MRGRAGCLYEGQKIAQNNCEAIDLVGLAKTFQARVCLEQGEVEKASETH